MLHMRPLLTISFSSSIRVPSFSCNSLRRQFCSCEYHVTFPKHFHWPIFIPFITQHDLLSHPDFPFLNAKIVQFCPLSENFLFPIITLSFSGSLIFPTLTSSTPLSSN